jgi:hypothetical protein
MRLAEQIDKLVAREAGAFDDAQRQPSPQVTAMLRHNHAPTIAGAAQNDVAACLVVEFKPSSFQGVDDLMGSDSGQARH